MSIKKDLEKVKELFLTNVDEEDYDDNLEKINEWEKDLRESEDFESWQESDITQSIITQCRQTYKELALTLIEKRDLTEDQRRIIYSKQDACLFLLSLVYKNVKLTVGALHREIQKALKVVD